MSKSHKSLKEILETVSYKGQLQEAIDLSQVICEGMGRYYLGQEQNVKLSDEDLQVMKDCLAKFNAIVADVIK